MNRQDGGPAFPSKAYAHNDLNPAGEPRIVHLPGMSLRDHFAAHAPITVADAMFACGVDAGSVGMLGTSQRQEVFMILAIMRMEYADAMLAERAKAGSNN